MTLRWPQLQMHNRPTPGHIVESADIYFKVYHMVQTSSGYKHRVINRSQLNAVPNPNSPQENTAPPDTQAHSPKPTSLVSRSSATNTGPKSHPYSLSYWNSHHCLRWILGETLYYYIIIIVIIIMILQL